MNSKNNRSLPITIKLHCVETEFKANFGDDPHALRALQEYALSVRSEDEELADRLVDIVVKSPMFHSAGCIHKMMRDAGPLGSEVKESIQAMEKIYKLLGDIANHKTGEEDEVCVETEWITAYGGPCEDGGP